MTDDVRRRWFGDHRVISEPDELDVIAGQLHAIANALAPIYRDTRTRQVGAASSNPVGLALRRFAMVLTRLAASERALSVPVWFPDEEQPVAEEMIRSEPELATVELDAFSVFLVGDLLLEEVAGAEMRRRTGHPGGWSALLDHLDDAPAESSDPFATTVRELNFVLRTCRNILVTHPGHGYGLAVGFGANGVVSIARVVPFDSTGESRDYDEAGRKIAAVAREIGMDLDADAEYAEMLDVIAYAGRMNRDQRRQVYEAMTMGGYGSVPFPAVARLVRDLVLEHARFVGVAPQRDAVEASKSPPGDQSQ